MDKPFDFLNQLKGKRVTIVTKNGEIIKGVFKCFDIHVNVVLEEANYEEEIVGKTMFIRGDVISFICPEE
jgi:small nuclear ribonucleoprotein (snRNP)-like protein